MPPVRSQSTPRSTCFSCEKKKLKCDLGKKTPCSNCEKAGGKCIPYNRKKDSDDKRKDTGKEKWNDGEKKQRKSDLSLAKELDIIRNSDTNRAGNYLGRDVSFDKPMETPTLAKEMSLPDTDLQLLKEQDAFTLPDNSIQHQLITTFMEHGHVWTPVIDPFWLTGQTPSYLLLQSMFVVASRITIQPNEHGLISDFYRRAKLLFFMGGERNPLIRLSSAILLHLYNPGSDEDVTDTSSFWLRTAESIAFELGLHKEPDPKDRNKGLRRRLWWTIVLRDCITSASEGRPRTLNLSDSYVLPPSTDDFPELNIQARVFPVHVAIALQLGETAERFLRKQTVDHDALENSLYRWVKQDFPSIYGPFPGCSIEARQVLVAYLANLIILELSPGSEGEGSSRSLIAASFIVGVLRDILQAGEACRLGGVFTFYALTAGLVLVPAGRIEVLRDVVNEEVIILKAVLHILSKQWPSASDALRTLQTLSKKTSRKKFKLDTGKIEDMSAFFEGLDTNWCRLWGPLVEDEPIQTVSTLVHSQKSIMDPYSNAQANACDDPLPIQYPGLLSRTSGSEYNGSWILGRS